MSMKYLKQTQERATDKSEQINAEIRALIEHLDEKAGEQLKT